MKNEYEVELHEIHDDEDPTLRMARDAFGRLDPDPDHAEPREDRARRRRERRRHRW